MHHHQTRIRRAESSYASLLNFNSGVWSEVALAESLSLARCSNMDSRRSSPLYANSSASSSKSNFSPLGRSITTWNTSVDDLAPPPPPAATTAPAVQPVVATAGTRTPPRRVQHLSQVIVRRERAEILPSNSLNRHLARRDARDAAALSGSVDNLSVLFEGPRDSNSYLGNSGSRPATLAGSIFGSQRSSSSTSGQSGRDSRLPPGSTQQQARTRPLFSARQPANRRPSFESLYDVTPPSAGLPQQRSMSNLRTSSQGAFSTRPASQATPASSMHQVIRPLRQPVVSAGPAAVAASVRAQRPTPTDGSSPAVAAAAGRIRRRSQLANRLSRFTGGLSDRLLRRTAQRGR